MGDGAPGWLRVTPPTPTGSALGDPHPADGMSGGQARERLLAAREVRAVDAVDVGRRGDVPDGPVEPQVPDLRTEALVHVLVDGLGRGLVGLGPTLVEQLVHLRVLELS